MTSSGNPEELKRHTASLVEVKTLDGLLYKSVCSCGEYESDLLASQFKALGYARQHRDIRAGYWFGKRKSD